MQLINRKKFWRLSLILQVLILFFSACSQSTSPKGVASIFELSLGAKKIYAELAITETQKAKGLMFRQSLPENNAMIFIYDSPQRVSFWMKNTEIPLDIAFLDKNGVITEIRQMYPRNLNSVTSSSDSIVYCIETNQNWFLKNNVGVGDKLDMEAFLAAVKARRAGE